MSNLNHLEKVLLAGPWVGEFGWELFCWHAYVRELSKKYDKTIIISTEHSRFLYEDFCDQFIAFSPSGDGLKDSFYKIGFNISSDLWSDFIKKTDYSRDRQNLTIFKPRRIGDPPRTHFSDSFSFGNHLITPEYVKFGMYDERYSNTIVIHARNRNLRSKDNWCEKKWKKLVDNFNQMCYNVVCIGLKEQSMHIQGTIDKRECNQQELVNILHSSICIFGPSSGAMHLASLCGCPQIVWSDNSNFIRYTKNWNPFKTDVVFLSEQNWQPTSDYIYEKFLHWKDKKNTEPQEGV